MNNRAIASAALAVATIVLVAFMVTGNTTKASVAAAENFSNELPNNTPTYGSFPAESLPSSDPLVASANITAMPRTKSYTSAGTGGATMPVGTTSCGRDTLSAADLLPAGDATNSAFALANPVAGGNDTVNYLTAGALIGASTRNTKLQNKQLRPDPVIAKKQVSPWLQSTLEPDLMDAAGKNAFYGVADNMP